jgi:hypothetical protein
MESSGRRPRNRRESCARTSLDLTIDVIPSKRSLRSESLP